jgi:hypothetical protein
MYICIYKDECLYTYEYLYSNVFLKKTPTA